MNRVLARRHIANPSAPNLLALFGWMNSAVLLVHFLHRQIRMQPINAARFEMTQTQGETKGERQAVRVDASRDSLDDALAKTRIGGCSISAGVTATANKIE